MNFNKFAQENAGYTVVQYYAKDGKYFSTTTNQEVQVVDAKEDLGEARACLSKIFNCEITNTKV